MSEINSAPLNDQLNQILAEVSGQCAAYINSTATSANRRRQLLQAGGTVRITADIASEDPASIGANLAAAERSGELAEKLKALGLELVPGSVSSNSVINVAPAPPPPSDDGGDSLSAGAIAGIAIAGLVVAAAALGGYVYYRKKKQGAPATQEPYKGQNMFSPNPAFDEETGQALPDPKGSQGGREISNAENPMFGSEEAGGDGGNPLYGGGGGDSPLAPGAVRTRGDTSAENPMFGGDNEGADPANPLFAGGDESPVRAGQIYAGDVDRSPTAPQEFSNQMFRGEGILDSQDVRPEDVNPMYETNQSQLSAPGSPGGYGGPTDSAAASAAPPSTMMSARSRQESAKEFPASNPMFAAGFESEEEEMYDASGNVANPMYQSARSAMTGSRDDLMATADSMGGEYGDAAAAAPAAAGARGSSSGQPFANPLAGQEAADDDGDNPLFAGSSDPKPAGQRRL